MHHHSPAAPTGGDPTGVLAPATVSFVQRSELLCSVVHNLLGRAADTEDVLQDTWLPGPLATGTDAAAGAERAAAVSLAMLVVPETLTPLERTVVGLREGFAYDHAEVAAVLGRTPAAVRRLAHRARRQVQARRPAPGPTRRRSGPRPGGAAAGRGGARYRAAGLVVDLAEVNGGPAALVSRGGVLVGVVVVDLTEQGDRVRAGYAVFNPDKLTTIAAAAREHP